jgi:hypothetical protein
MKIAFLAFAKPAACQALSKLVRRYGQSDLSDADYLLAIGGVCARPVRCTQTALRSAAFRNDCGRCAA